jgi:hypothetical protein
MSIIQEERILEEENEEVGGVWVAKVAVREQDAGQLGNWGRRMVTAQHTTKETERNGSVSCR